MRTVKNKISLLSLTVVLSLFIIAACSKGKMDDLELNGRASTAQNLGFNDENSMKGNDASQNRLLAQVRSATAKYQRVEVAEADGYVLGSHCVYDEDLGAGMGYHFVNQDLVGPFFDPLKPQALLYELGKNGKFNLVGVEYIVIDIGQDHPHFGNHPFDVGGTPIPVPHYSLHVWVWKNNPWGMYTPYNPKVSCH